MKTKANKLIKTIALAGFLLSCLYIKPNVIGGNTTTTETEKVIRESFKIPVTKIDGDQKVEVLFSTDGAGLVNFVLAKTENQNLKREIEKQFLNLRFSKLNSTAVNSVVIHFITL